MIDVIVDVVPALDFDPQPAWQEPGQLRGLIFPCPLAFRLLRMVLLGAFSAAKAASARQDSVTRSW